MTIEPRFCPRCGGALVELEHGGRRRRACAGGACDWVYWDNPVPVVAAIVEHGGRVLLVRNHGWPAHWFGLVTGFLEAREDPALAVVREVLEETGLRAGTPALLGLYPFERRNQLIIAYHVTVDGDAPVAMDGEIAEFRWVPIAQVRPWNASTGLALRDWLRSRGFEREPVPFNELGHGTGS